MSNKLEIIKGDKELVVEFFKENHWLICDCDIDSEISECNMENLLPAFRVLISAAHAQGKLEGAKELADSIVWPKFIIAIKGSVDPEEYESAAGHNSAIEGCKLAVSEARKKFVV
jgi:hypothetical protein